MKIKNKCSKILDTIKARLYKTENIKTKWVKKYQRVTDTEPIEVDYKIYPDFKVATKGIFNNIFKQYPV